MPTGLLGFIAASGMDFTRAMRDNDFRKAASELTGLVGGGLEEMFKNAASSLAETFTQAEGGYELFNKVNKYNNCKNNYSPYR